MSDKSRPESWRFTLRLCNWVCFEYAEISFPPGVLNIVTGPNGVGKTLLFEAIRFVCGSNQKIHGTRWDEYIRKGENEAWVEVTIKRGGKKTSVRRVVKKSNGKSYVRYYLNNKPVLKEDALSIIRKYVPDPDNPFIFADAITMHSLRKESRVGPSPEGLLEYFERGIFVEQTILRNGKEERVKMSLKDIKKRISESHVRLYDVEVRKNQIKNELEVAKKKDIILEEKVRRLKEKKEYERKLEMLEREKRWALVEEREKILKELNEESIKLENKEKKLEVKLREVNDRYRELEEKKKDLENRRKEKEREINKIESQMYSFLRMASGIEEEIREIDEKIKKLEDQRNRVKDGLERKKNEYDQITKKWGELRSRHEKLCEEIEKLKDILEKTKQYRYTIEKIKLLKREERLVEREEEDIKIRIDTVKEELLDLEKKKQKLEEETDDMQREIDAFEKKHGLTNMKEEEKDRYIRERIDKLKKEKEDCEKKRKRLLKEKEHMEMRRRLHEEEIRELLGGESVKRIVKKTFPYDNIRFFIDIVRDTVKNDNDKNKVLAAFPHPHITNAIVVQNSIQAEHCARYLYSRKDVDKPIPIIVSSKYKLERAIREISSYYKTYDDIPSALKEGSACMAYIEPPKSSSNGSQFFKDKMPVFISRFWDMHIILPPTSLPQWRIVYLREAINNIKNDLDKKNAEIRRIEEEEHEKQREIESLQRILTTRQKFKEKLREKFNVEEQIKRKKQEEEELSNESERLKNEKKELERKIDELQRSLPEDADALLKKYESMEREVRRLESERNRILEDLENTAKKTEEITKQMNELERKCTKLETEIDVYTNRKQEIIERLGEYKNEIERLQGTLKVLESEKKALDNQIRAINNKIYQLIINERTPLTNKLKELRERRKNLERRIKETQDVVERLRKEAEILGPRPDTVRSLQEIEDEIIRTQVTIEYRFKDIDDSVEEDYKHNKNLIRELERKLKSLEDEEKRIKRNILELKRVYKETIEKKKMLTEREINRVFSEAGINKKCLLSFISSDTLDGEVSGILVNIFHEGEEVESKGVSTLSSGEYTLFQMGLIVAHQRLNPSKLYMYDDFVLHLDQKNLRLVGRILQNNIDENKIVVLIVPLKTDDIRSIIELTQNYRIYLLWKDPKQNHTIISTIPSYEELQNFRVITKGDASG